MPGLRVYQVRTGNLRKPARPVELLRGGNSTASKRNEPRRGWAAGLTEQGRRGCIGVYGAGDDVDFRS